MPSSALERLQRRFVRSITFAPDADFAASIAGGGRLTPASAVEVYRRAYPARLTEALGETFEACWRVLGDDGFFDACRSYIARFPSLSHNLADYGAGFPDHLRSRPESEYAPFLGDLARFEWEFKELFHRAPHAGLSAAELAERTKESSVLRFGAAATLLRFEHRVYGIWSRDREDESSLGPSDWEGSERVLLYKNGGSEVFGKSLGGPEYAALFALMAGAPLGEALAGADGLDEDGVSKMFGFLAGSALITDVM